MDAVEIGAVITGLVQVFKFYSFPTKYCPLLSLILGPVITVGQAYSQAGGMPVEATLISAIVSGVAIGAVATGAVGLTKEVASKI